MTPPFRVDHIGSFIRPQRLLEAVKSRSSDLKAIQGDSVREIVAFQESLGLPSITDGEFRRRSWSAGFIETVEGFGLRDGTLTFREETRVIGVASSPYARAKPRGLEPLTPRLREWAEDHKVSIDKQRRSAKRGKK